MTEVFSLTEARSNSPSLRIASALPETASCCKSRGKRSAALVPPSDLRALEALEDRLDLSDALAALADYRANGGVEFERLKAEIGL